MTRGGGSIQAGFAYHLISRFVAREWFIESALERRTYLALLGSAIAATDWRCFAFAIMSSHIHLALVAGSQPLATWLRPMHTQFAAWLNLRRERIGGIFVKGPKVIAMQPFGAARLINYIHLNPVRANVVARPADSDWTSHRAYAGVSPAPNWLDVDCGLALANAESRDQFADWIDTVSIDREQLDEVRLEPKKAPGRPRRIGPGLLNNDSALEIGAAGDSVIDLSDVALRQIRQFAGSNHHLDLNLRSPSAYLAEKAKPA